MELTMELMPDLIIADVMMPVMDGLEMVRHIKNIPTSTIPIILLTAKSDKETELESIQLHIDAFIPKPFEPDILLSRVEQLLHSRETLWGESPYGSSFHSEGDRGGFLWWEVSLANVIHLIEEHISDSELNVNAFVNGPILITSRCIAR